MTVIVDGEHGVSREALDGGNGLLEQGLEFVRSLPQRFRGDRVGRFQPILHRGNLVEALRRVLGELPRGGQGGRRWRNDSGFAHAGGDASSSGGWHSAGRRG